VDKYLPEQENNPDYFGEQFVVDETGEFLRRENRLLLNSVDLSFERVFEQVNLLGGLAIPAHVDRSAFGLFANLGLVPADVPVEALEISRHLPAGEAVQRYPQIKSYPILLGGDAHRLDEFLGANEFCLAAPTVAEIRLALRGQAGRSLAIRSITHG
jgi:hypothetical protein